MINRLGYILLVVLVFASCKKVDIDVPVDTPVFSVNANVGGTDLSWEAGNDDFYMFTGFEKDGLDVYTLTGRLAKDNDCVTDCEESLTFKIRGNAITPAVNDFDINQALLLNSNLSFSKMDSVVSPSIINTYTFQADLKNISNSSFITDYSWTINGENFTDSVAIYEDSLFGGINLTADFTDNTGCVTSFTQNNITTNNNCSLDIDILGNGGGDLELVSIPSGMTSPQIQWNNNPNQMDSIFPIDSIYSNNDIFLSVNDLQGNCSIDVKMCLELDTINSNGLVTDVTIPQVNYLVQTDTTFDPIDEQLSHVEIIYQDATGIYSSFNGNNNNSTFTITKIEDFEDNENGEKTKKLTVDYNATLYDPNGLSKAISGSGVIGIAYPNN